MSTAQRESQVGVGYEALATGDWDAARQAFELVELIAERAEHRPIGRSAFELTYFDIFPMGGAVNRVAPTATAFTERSAPWLVSLGANWTDAAENEQQIAWVRESWDAVDACAGTGAMYLNFTGRADEPAAAHVDRAHASNLGRFGRDQADLRPRQLLPPQQQHRTGVASIRAMSQFVVTHSLLATSPIRRQRILA